MKKVLTLVLALCFALCLAVPSMAFTADTEGEDDSILYQLSIYLVEYDDNDFFGITTLPESDRGYAKNEIVAAVVELFVPEDEEILFGEYRTLVFGGENVDLDVTDNYNDAGDIDIATTDNIADLPVGAYILEDSLIEDEIRISIGEYDGFAGEETYKWLFFAKVTNDEASLYAKLTDGAKDDAFEEDKGAEMLRITLSGVEYEVELESSLFHHDGDVSALKSFDADIIYEITWTDDNTEYSIFILADEDYKSIGMAIAIDDNDPDPDNNGDVIPLGVNTKGELGIVDGAVIKTSGDVYDDIMDVYEDVVVDVFGLDYFNIGNYVRKSFFEDLVSPDTIIATVDIEPWTAYVSIPDNIVTDPPKTGDAASIVGFVMVALAGGSAVALKKRG